jgi:hypothetical protein
MSQHNKSLTFIFKNASSWSSTEGSFCMHQNLGTQTPFTSWLLYYLRPQSLFDHSLLKYISPIPLASPSPDTMVCIRINWRYVYLAI